MLRELVVQMEDMLQQQTLIQQIKANGTMVLIQAANQLRLDSEDNVEKIPQLFKSVALKIAVEKGDFALVSKILEPVGKLDHNWNVALLDYPTPLELCAQQLRDNWDNPPPEVVLQITKLLLRKGGKITECEINNGKGDYYAFDFAIHFKDQGLFNILHQIIEAENLPARYREEFEGGFKELEKLYLAHNINNNACDDDLIPSSQSHNLHSEDDEHDRLSALSSQEIESADVNKEIHFIKSATNVPRRLIQDEAEDLEEREGLEEEYSSPLSNENEVSIDDRDTLMEKLSSNKALLSQCIKTNNTKEAIKIIKVIKEIYEHEDDISHYKSILNYANEEGNTPLLLCLEQIVKVDERYGLSQESYPGASINLISEQTVHQDYYQDREPYMEIIKGLLSLGANLEAQNDLQQTASQLLNLLHDIDDTEHLTQLFEQHQAVNKFEILANNLLEDISSLKDDLINKAAEQIEWFITLKYQSNVEESEETRDRLSEAEKTLKKFNKKIAEKPYVSYRYVKVYEFISKLVLGNIDFKIEINERFKNIKEPDENYYYIFYNDKLYRLTESAKDHDTIVLQLVTTLVYEAKHHSVDSANMDLRNSEQFLFLRELIAKLEPTYAHHNLSDFGKLIEKEEKKKGTYFGENISDDSDSEEERQYKNRSKREKALLTSYTQLLFSR